MAEYIEREALIEFYERAAKDEWNKKTSPSSWSDAYECVIADIDDQFPAADVVEVRHGHWYSTEYEYFTCSECGNSFYNGCESTAEAKQRLKDGLYDNYCGHCGAKMDGKGEGE